MADRELNRRRFHQLSVAAFGGVLAGAAATQAEDKPQATSPLLGDPHVCRGLNTCQGKGADKMNTCAGQGTCATAKAHACGGENDCKGQGGCGATPGENACKGQGLCHVPLEHAGAWEKARKRFEELMTKAGKKFGPAPAKK